MDKLKAYLLSNFSQIYFSIFMPLYVIASVILLVKIAAYTAYIQLTLLEMAKLYIFLLPELLFYTLPVVFFISAVMTIAKLSFDYEMLVIFSLGIKPATLIKFFTKLAFYQSLLLFVLFFLVSPHTKMLSFNFMDKKRSEAKFNIEASEYGHKFGDWMIFVGESKEEEGSYGNVILFNQNKEDETLLIADSADVISVANTLKLELHRGKGFTYSPESLSQMKFRQMHINDTSNTDAKQYQNPLEFWFGDLDAMKTYKKDSYEYKDHEDDFNKKMIKLSTQILITLFPLASIFLILSIGVINARHQKSFTYLYIFMAVIAYYASTFVVSKALGLYAIAIILSVTLALTTFIHKQKISRRY